MERKGHWMQTHSGRRFYPLDPRLEDVRLEDIGHALSLINRFCGHTTKPYSVAQHSLGVARLLAEEGNIWIVILEGLLHDAMEAYVGDMIMPLKKDMPEFRKIEDAVDQVIRQRFGLPQEMHPSVHEADMKMLMTERRDVMMPTNETWMVTAKPARWTIENSNWCTIKEQFIVEAEFLIRKVKDAQDE